MKKIPLNMQYKRTQIILGTLAAVALAWAWPAAAADREISGNISAPPPPAIGGNADAQIQPEAPREMRRPLREREFLRRRQWADQPDDWHPRRRLTDEERQGLRQDLDRARREFYRDPDRQRSGPDRTGRPNIPDRPERPNSPAEPAPGDNK